MKFGEYLINIRKIIGQYHKTLVKLERLLNKAIDTININILDYRNYYKALKEGKVISWTSNEIPFDPNLLDDLLNIDFINDYFSYLLDVERINKDLLTMQRMYEEMKKYHYIYKVTDKKDFDFNILQHLEKVSQILNFLENSYQSTIRLCAISRLLLKESEKKTLLFFYPIKYKYKKDFDKSIEAEVGKLKKEIDEIMKKSQEKIVQLKGKISKEKE